MVKPTINFTPDPRQMALWPDASGNDINGAGEADFRKPDHVYWRDPGEIAFGALQKWFYRKNDHPALQKGRRARMQEEKIPLAPLNETPAEKSPRDWSDQIKAEAARLGANAVGITKMQADWCYAEHDLPFRWIVVLGIEMNYEIMTTAPEMTAGAEVVHQYARGMTVSKRLAGWLRKQGHDASPEHGPFAGPLTLIPPALAAGIGELGKHGSIINRKLGSNFRLAAVLTNLELAPDQPDDFGADDFCLNCQICMNHCPPDAIFAQKQTVRGTKKWYVDFDKCLPYFNETAGCGICITVCPFSRPGVRDGLLAKLARRAT